MKSTKLALPDELLLQIQKPARYLGNEMHAVRKDKKIPIRFAMCFPDVYEIGMSHLGIQILYELFNRREDTWCERVFSPWTDMDRLLRDHQIPLFALESQDPVREFDFLGITLQFELCYTNILQILDLSGIPLKASQRTEEDPIVIGGGPCAYNPEPIAPFFDLFYIGDGETSYDALLDLYRSMKERGEGRTAFLRAAAQIPGIYVPSLYEVIYDSCDTAVRDSLKIKTEYRETKAGKPEAGKTEAGEIEARGGEKKVPGTIASFSPKYPDVPARVRRQVAADLDDREKAPYPIKPLIPFITVTQDRVAVELQRGCIRGCRFCQAGMIYRPNRERSLSTVKAYADAMLDSTGQDDILLSSLSSSDYSCIHEIVDYISDNREADRVKLQVPSLRIDSFSLDLMARVQDVRRSSLTFAPEAGSQRLRDVINKGITEEEILAGAREAFRGGWNKVKLYFMLGLPTETEEDRVAISDLANRISAAYYEEVPKEKRNGRCQITVSTSFFVPKAFTPFQWAPMYRPGDYLGFAATVNHAIYAAHNHRSIRYSWHDAQMIYLEGVLARGDRRVADLILEAYRLGALFDCWLETWDFSRWEQAARNIGLDMDFFAVRERGREEILPWDFIDVGIRRDFLWSEWEKAHKAVLTPDCREACSACGAASYGCGICMRQGEIKKAAAKPAASERYQERHQEKYQERYQERQRETGGVSGKNPVNSAEQEGLSAAVADSENPAAVSSNDLCIRIRMRLAKYGPMKFIGHLELMRFLQKCLRRTDIDVHYSDGITPRMIMHTAMPLGLGLESTGEYVDIEIGTPVSTDHALSQLRPLMPEGLEILDFRQIGEAVPEGGGTAKKPEKAMSVVAAAEYAVRFRDSFAAQEKAGAGAARGGDSAFLPENWKEILLAFTSQDQILWTKETKKGFRTLDMKPLVYDFSIGADDTIFMCLCSRVGENLRPEQLIGEAFRRSGYILPEDALQIRRLDLLAERSGRESGGSGSARDGSDELQEGLFAEPAGNGPSEDIGPEFLRKRFISLGEM